MYATYIEEEEKCLTLELATADGLCLRVLLTFSVFDVISDSTARFRLSISESETS